MDPTKRGNDSRRATLRQIAKTAGVSLMTVSRALRNHANVRPEVAGRIRRIADEAGYRPDPKVATLMNHLRSRNKAAYTASLAGITGIPEKEESGQVRLIRENARRRAEELGFRLELFRVEKPEACNRRLERTLLNRGIEGVLLLRMRAPVAVDRLLDWTRFSTVLATSSVLKPGFAHVGPNYFHNARMLCAQLVLRGKRRIGFVGTETYCVRTNHAFTAAIAWQGASDGLPAVAPLVFSRQEIDRPVLRAWFVRERPDAIVVYSQEHVGTVGRELRLGGGGPVALACTDVDPTNVACMGINERPDIIGHRSINLLAGMLHQNERGVPPVAVGTLVEGTWIEPETGDVCRAQ